MLLAALPGGAQVALVGSGGLALGVGQVLRGQPFGVVVGLRPGERLAVQRDGAKPGQQGAGDGGAEQGAQGDLAALAVCPGQCPRTTTG